MLEASSQSTGDEGMVNGAQQPALENLTSIPTNLITPFLPASLDSLAKIGQKGRNSNLIYLFFFAFSKLLLIAKEYARTNIHLWLIHQLKGLSDLS